MALKRHGDGLSSALTGHEGTHQRGAELRRVTLGSRWNKAAVSPAPVSDPERCSPAVIRLRSPLRSQARVVPGT